MKMKMVLILVCVVMIVGLAIGCSSADRAYVEIVGGAGTAVQHDLDDTDFHNAVTLAEFSVVITDDGVVGLVANQELDNKTLDSSVGKGTWTNSGVWILPAFTLSGTVTCGTNRIFDVGSSSFLVNTTGSSTGLKFISTQDGNIGPSIITIHVSASPEDDNTIRRDEIYGRNDAAEQILYCDIRYRIEDMTDGTEAGKIGWYLISGGTSNLAMTLSSSGVLAVDDSYGTFDEYDDAELLREGIRDGWHAPTKDTTSYVRVKDSLATGTGGR